MIRSPRRPDVRCFESVPAAFALAALLLGAAGCTSNTPAPASNLPAPTANKSPGRIAPTIDPALAQRLQAEVNWLADDAREGRRAGSESARASARWIAALLADIGLEPAGEDGGWFQDFSVALDPRDGGGSRLEFADGGAQVGMKAVPLFCSEPGDASGPLVDCGFAIEDTERGWDDFAGKDLAGKIALIVRGTPAISKASAANEQVAVQNPHTGGDTQLVSTGDGWGSGGSIFTKVMNAKRHGAVGVVLIPRTDAEAVLAFDAGHGARSGLPAIMVDAKSGRELVKRALGLDALDLEHPAPSTAPSSGSITIHADVVRTNGIAQNVLGRLRGRDSSRCVVIGAHYDHLGRGGAGSLAPNAHDEIHNGADDNASGTATVIEIARELRARGELPCDVIVALWSGEELGLLGSEYWASHPTVPFDRVRANLNLDMVGRAGNHKLQVLGAGTSSTFASWMKDAGAASGLDLTVSVSGQAMGGSSDHQTFLKRKVPALHLFSGLHADYHKPSDDADKFEAEGASHVAMLGADFVERMARAGTLDFVEPKAPEAKGGEQKVTAGGFKVRLGTIPNYAYDGRGVLIDGASQDTPAERAGLIKGDVLVRIGDVELANVYDLTYALGRFKPGDVVLVKFLRDGKEQETKVTLARPNSDVQ